MHRVVKNNLESYVDGTLLPVRRREVESHLDGCRLCRGEVDELRLTREWMRALKPDETLSPAPGFYNRVRLRIVEGEEAARRAWPFWQLLPAFGRQLAYAVVALAMLVGAYVVTFQRTEQQAASQVVVNTLVRTDAPVFTSDNQANREHAMQAIVTPVSAVEGD